MQRAAVSHYIVTHERVSSSDQMQNLKAEWAILEQQSSPSFFLSWYWIEAWLTCCANSVEVIRVKLQGQLVALALVSSHRSKRHLIFSFNSIHLNHTGDDKKDQIWPEYSGLLTTKEHAASAYFVTIKYLYESNKRWDEFYSGVMAETQFSEFVQSGRDLGLWERTYWEAKGFSVDLAKVRQTTTSYLDSLSKNTRSQIRRTFSKLKEQGQLEFVEAKTQAEAKALLLAIAELHQQKWQLESGFNNPVFSSFHNRLVEKNFGHGVIQLCGIYLNGRLLAGLYNFVYNNTVLFYLSGIVQEKDNRLKIGLAVHAMCIQQHLDAGKDSYDFMGGEMRYKKSLSNTHYDLGIAVLEKPNIKIRAEHFARRLKQMLIKTKS